MLDRGLEFSPGAHCGILSWSQQGVDWTSFERHSMRQSEWIFFWGCPTTWLQKWRSASFGYRRDPSSEVYVFISWPPLFDYSTLFSDYLYNRNVFWKSSRKSFVGYPKYTAIDNRVKRFFIGIFFSCLTIIFLFAPRRYLKSLLEVDTLFLNGDEWRGHVQRLADDWAAFNVLVSFDLYS